jgi:hypothetical protein
VQQRRERKRRDASNCMKSKLKASIEVHCFILDIILAILEIQPKKLRLKATNAKKGRNQD